MSFLRAGGAAGSPVVQGLLWVVGLVISCSLISIGGLIWINNSWAVIPDEDPSTFFEISVIWDELDGNDDISALDPDGDGRIPVPGGTLLKGNGDQDDNKQEPMTIVYRPGALEAPNFSDAPLFCREDLAVKSYLGFGHLKIFPDAPTFISLKKCFLMAIRLPRCIRVAAFYIAKSGYIYVECRLKLLFEGAGDEAVKKHSYTP